MVWGSPSSHPNPVQLGRLGSEPGSSSHPLLGRGLQAGAGRGRQVRVAVCISNPHSERFPLGLRGIIGWGAPGSQPRLSWPFEEQRRAQRGQEGKAGTAVMNWVFSALPDTAWSSRQLARACLR